MPYLGSLDGFPGLDPNLDISVALTSDKKQLTIAVVNSSAESEKLLFDIENLETSRSATSISVTATVGN